MTATHHATTVALGDRGALILGPSGSGKSGLALQLMALGARLVADDRTILTVVAGGLIATCPPALRGRIEARGIGILNAEPVESAAITLAINLGESGAERLPPQRSIVIEGVTIPLVRGSGSAHFPAAVIQLLRAGRFA